MRPIKFRAWDRTEKKMYFYDFSEVFDGGMYTKTDEQNELELMQSLGIFDRNGKEIYEKDLLVAISKNPAHPALRGPVVYEPSIAAFGILMLVDQQRVVQGLGPILTLVWNQEAQLQVDGNLYENPPAAETPPPLLVV